MRRGRRVGSVWPPECAHSRGRRVALSSSRSRHFWTRATGRTCADRVRLTEAPQRTRESSLCTCKILRCKLCRFVKPFVLRPLPKGPVAKAVIVYFMACKYANNRDSCAYVIAYVVCACTTTRSPHRSGRVSKLKPSQDSAKRAGLSLYPRLRTRTCAAVHAARRTRHAPKHSNIHGIIY